jgi:hypothetical protein
MVLTLTCIYKYIDDAMKRRQADQSKVMYSLRLDRELAQLLKDVKARDGVPESEQIRRALLIWFEQKGVLKTKRK